MLDGAGVPPRFRTGCVHEVAWFSHALAGRLLLRAQDPSVPLRQALAGAITDVRSLHEERCDLDRGGPSATVGAARWGAEHLDHPVHCDPARLLAQTDGTTARLSDPRVDAVVRE